MSAGTIRSEWIRIWRWSFVLGGIGLSAAFAALISVFIFVAAPDAPSGDVAAGPPGGGFATKLDIAEPGGFLIPIASVSTLTGIVLLALWAIAVATDYSTGLIRILVQAQPNRVNLLSGKIIALALFTMILTLITTFVVVFVARPLARLEGIDTTQWKTDALSEMLNSYFNFAVAGLVWGLIGLMIAVLTRSSAISIGIGVGYLLVFESLIGIIEPDLVAYLPGGTLNALVAGGTDDLSRTAALGLSALYGGIAIVVSLLSFRSRAITS